ncbi:unnamed protein product [Cladocopium goreaui]|uniref:Uncharacterized protein n=1 Tax=Cladocopium goreaui TaxID=2562237 RepID=A0A9P1BJB6_9DINO|nr:unnamed protein product [Cladocopium goreaui]
MTSLDEEGDNAIGQKVKDMYYEMINGRGGKRSYEEDANEADEKKHVKKLNKRRAKELRKQQKKLQDEMAKADSDDEIPFFMQDASIKAAMRERAMEEARKNASSSSSSGSSGKKKKKKDKKKKKAEQQPAEPKGCMSLLTPHGPTAVLDSRSALCSPVCSYNIVLTLLSTGKKVIVLVQLIEVLVARLPAQIRGKVSHMCGKKFSVLNSALLLHQRTFG